jgi:ribosomal protein L37E
MALLKCPECGAEISDQCQSCPKCGFPVANKICKLRIKANIGENEDIFSVRVEFYHNRTSLGFFEQRFSFSSPSVCFDASFFGPVDFVEIGFEEHLCYDKTKFDLNDLSDGFRAGISFYPVKNVDDVPTYAGGYTYYHPHFKFDVVDYDSLKTDCQPDFVSL